MARQLVSLQSLDQLPAASRTCVAWEFAGGGTSGSDAAAREQLKARWLADTLDEWGTCGQLVLVDGRRVGHVLYAPSRYLPGAARFATAPAGDDSILLGCMWVDPLARGAGLGKLLVHGVVREAIRRGARSVEAFGRAPAVPIPAGRCVLPAAFWQAAGFTVVRPHPVTPRLRLEVRSVLTVRDDAGAALVRVGERLRRRAPRSA